MSVYFIYVFFHYAEWFEFSWLAQYPKAFFWPGLSVAAFWDTFPGPVFYSSLNWILFLFCAVMLVGFRTKLVSILLSISLFFSFSFFYVFGNFDQSVLLFMVPVVFAFSNWGNEFSLDKNLGRVKKPVRQWPLTLMSLLIGFAFFTAGVMKLYGGWLDTNSHATLGAFLNEFEINQRDRILAPFFYNLQSEWFWEFTDFFTVFFELGMLPAVFFPKVFRFFLFLGLIFHFQIFLILGIDFTYHLLIFIVFLDWEEILGRFQPIIEKIYNFLEKVYSRVKRWHIPVVWGGLLGLFYLVSPLENKFLSLLARITTSYQDS